MKAVFVLLSLFSVQAFACPDFTGSYICQNEEGGDEGSYAMVMTQRPTAGGAIYTSTVDGESEDLIIDGKPHMADPEQPKIIYVGKCERSVVKVNVKGPIEEDGQAIGSMKSDVQYFMSGNKLMTKSVTTINYQGQQYSQSLESYCTKR